MNFYHFIVWLTVGAVVGWFASKMVRLENQRSPKTPVKVTLFEES